VYYLATAVSVAQQVLHGASTPQYYLCHCGQFLYEREAIKTKINPYETKQKL
jgi:hypothetical protein